MNNIINFINFPIIYDNFNFVNHNVIDIRKLITSTTQILNLEILNYFDYAHFCDEKHNKYMNIA